MPFEAQLVTNSNWKQFLAIFDPGLLIVKSIFDCPLSDVILLNMASIPGLGQNIFISWFTNPPTVIFRKVEKNQI